MVGFCKTCRFVHDLYAVKHLHVYEPYTTDGKSTLPTNKFFKKPYSMQNVLNTSSFLKRTNHKTLSPVLFHFCTGNTSEATWPCKQLYETWKPIYYTAAKILWSRERFLNVRIFMNVLL